MESRRVAAVIVLTAAFLAIYLPDLGHGLIKDDFGWIRSSTLHRPADVLGLFLAAPTGFYRPLVALTFGVDALVFGLHPLGYALTNLALVFATTGAIIVLARGVDLPPGAAIFAGALWAFNLHGINMALLWDSGRTSLLLTLFAVAAAIALRRGGRWSVAAWTLAALWSKETAVLLPPILWVWAWLWARDVRTAWRQTWPAFATLGAYLVLRSRTEAMTPLSAPSYYRFTVAPVHVATNILQYADRACTWAGLILLLLALIVRRRPRFARAERRVMTAGLTWLALGYALAIFLPVRSSLYACLPSVGAVLIAAAVATALWRELAPANAMRTATAALVLPFVLWPLYHVRNRRWVEPADRSTVVLAGIAQWAGHLPAGSTLTIEDEQQDRVSIDSVFGSQLPAAVNLTLANHLNVRVRTTRTPDIGRPAPDSGRRTSDSGRTRISLLVLPDGHVRPGGAGAERAIPASNGPVHAPTGPLH